jgi:hypothetical protein
MARPKISGDEHRKKAAERLLATAIRTADRFVAEIQTGPLSICSLDARTLGEAWRRAAELNVRHGHTGQAAKVFAVLPDGDRVQITDSGQG